MHVDVEHLSFASSSFQKLSLNAFFGDLFACVGRVKHRGSIVFAVASGIETGIETSLEVDDCASVV